MTSIKQDELKKEIVELLDLIRELEEKDLNLNDNKPDIKYVSKRLKEAREQLQLKKEALTKLLD